MDYSWLSNEMQPGTDLVNIHNVHQTCRMAAWGKKRHSLLGESETMRVCGGWPLTRGRNTNRSLLVDAINTVNLYRPHLRPPSPTRRSV